MQTPHYSWRLTLSLSFALSACTAFAQQSAPAPLPDSPGVLIAAVNAPVESSSFSSSDAATQQTTSPQAATVPAPDPSGTVHVNQQTKRILGIIPNFRAVSAGTILPPQSVKDKFITTSQDSFDYSAFLLPGIIAAESQARNATPEFHQGLAGYGRYYWHSYVDQTIENYMVEFIVPAIAHEDTRYYTLGSGGFAKRAGYSLSRVFITRTDSGKRTFNAGEVVGAGMGAGISNLYYPSPERTLSNTGQQWATNVGIDAVTFLFKEFWPELNHSLFHDKQ